MRSTINRDRLLFSPRLHGQRRANSPIGVQHPGVHATRAIFLPLATLLLLIASACNFPSANGTPTLSVDAIFTAAGQTLAAQQATQIALTPPTAEASPTLLFTFPSVTPSTLSPFGTATTSSVGCDSSVFVKDVTVPDGTVMAPGNSFTKTWLVLNNGTCPWTTSYKLVFASGAAMGGNAVAVVAPVPANQQVQLSVNLTAPSTAGNYTGWWRLQNDKGQFFGNGYSVVVTVSGSATGSPPVPTNTPPTPANTIVPTSTP